MSFLKKLFGRKQEEVEVKEKIDESIGQQEKIVESEPEASEEALEEEVAKEESPKEEQESAETTEEEVAIESEEESAKEGQESAETTGEEVAIESEEESTEEEESAETTEEEVAIQFEEESTEEEQESAETIEQVVEESVESEEEPNEIEIEKGTEEDVEVLQAEVEEQQPKKKSGLFGKLLKGLSKTRDNILGNVEDVLKGFKKIDEELYEELEEALIIADFGVEPTMDIMERLREKVKEDKLSEPMELKEALQSIITEILTSVEVKPIIDPTKPNVVLVIGVNGAGKTTSIGKLSNQLKDDGKKVVVAAADTFRAAAIEQLNIWTDRAGVDIIKHTEGADPGAVIYDGIQAAKARKADVLICDTAGRLQNKTNLMKELSKISKIIEKEYPEAHKEVLIVLDSTAGQNVISQVKLFNEAANVDGIILTKLDGTAKGGAVVGICSTMKVPVKYIGVGEQIEDLQVFNPEDFAKALFMEQ